MKILAVSDIHGKKNENLINYLKNEDIDLVILAGDITDFGPLEFVDEFISELFECDVDVFAIPGNCDPAGICNAIKDSGALCLHNQLVGYENTIIMGYGGSNPTPFNTPGETSDENIYAKVYELFAEYEYVANDKVPRVTILLTHAPPYNTKADTIENGTHVGSQGIKKTIHEFQPTINICGHIHEAVSIDTVGKTTVVNPGMLEENHAALLVIDDKANVDVSIIDL
ncbi:MAG: metallophosphoesterase [Methanobacteriaceae archaeon]|nr:metallophosphoesterase [Methanobacteriaceae archaeon]